MHAGAILTGPQPRLEKVAGVHCRRHTGSGKVTISPGLRVLFKRYAGIRSFMKLTPRSNRSDPTSPGSHKGAPLLPFTPLYHRITPHLLYTNKSIHPPIFCLQITLQHILFTFPWPFFNLSLCSYFVHLKPTNLKSVEQVYTYTDPFWRLLLQYITILEDHVWKKEQIFSESGGKNSICNEWDGPIVKSTPIERLSYYTTVPWDAPVFKCRMLSQHTHLQFLNPSTRATSHLITFFVDIEHVFTEISIQHAIFMFCARRRYAITSPRSASSTEGGKWDWATSTPGSATYHHQKLGPCRRLSNSQDHK